MLGGSVDGGKVHGQFPSPLGPENSQWLTRGRWIPTTPWDSVFNSIGQWIGVHEDADLDLALPNRQSFGQCNLFTDKDLFVDGACECVLVNNVATTVCDDITYSPTSMPTESPTESPSINPTTTPTVSESSKLSGSFFFH